MSHFFSCPFVSSLCIALFTCSSLTAALPPLYQGMKEFNAVLHDPRFVKELPAADVLESIKKTPTGYEVTTNRSVLEIEIEYLPIQHPGPAEFLLHFHPIQSL